MLRGGAGIFGIGTADGDGAAAAPLVATQPREHTQCYQGLRFSWYALGANDRNYRRLPIRMTIGPDLAFPLHGVWAAIEQHSERLDRLCRRLARVRFEVMPGAKGPELHAVVSLDKKESLRAILGDGHVQYCLVRKGQWLVSDCREPAVDRGVYLMLAALAEEEL